MARILLVDDEADVLETIEAVVKSGGHSVVTARSGLAALDILDGSIAFDLIITDIIMPGLNGFNLARMANLRRSDMKILYLTGFHEQAVVMRDAGERLGKLLTKPISPADLRTEIAAALAPRPN